MASFWVFFSGCLRSKIGHLKFLGFNSFCKDLAYIVAFYLLLFYIFYILSIEGFYFDSGFFSSVGGCKGLGFCCSADSRIFSIREGGISDKGFWLGPIEERLTWEVIRSAYQVDLLKVDTVGDLLREYTHRRYLSGYAVPFSNFFSIKYDPKLTMWELRGAYVHIPQKLWIDNDYASLSITLKYAGKPTLEELHQKVSNELWESFRKTAVSGKVKPLSVKYVDYFFDASLQSNVPFLLDRNSIIFIKEFPRLVQEGVWKEVLEAKERVFADCYHFWNRKLKWGYWEGKHWWDYDKSLVKVTLPDWRADVFEYFLKHWVRLDEGQLELVSKELRRTYWSNANTGTFKATNRVWYPEGPKLDLEGKAYDDYYTPKTRWTTYVNNEMLGAVEDLESKDNDLLASEVREIRRLGYKDLVAKEAEAMGWVNWYNRRFSG